MFRGKILNTFLTRIAFTLKENKKTLWLCEAVFQLKQANMPLTPEVWGDYRYVLALSWQGNIERRKYFYTRPLAKNCK